MISEILTRISEILTRNQDKLDPMEHEVTDEGLQVEIRGGSKTVVDWINGKGRDRDGRGAFGGIQRQLRAWWGNKTNPRRRENDWAVLFSVNTMTMPMRKTGPKG